MTEHEEINALLPFYVSGKLTDSERIRVHQHLEACAECREEMGLWQNLSGVMKQDYTPLKAPQAALDQALAAIEGNEAHVNFLVKSWRIMQAQVPLVNKEIWTASLLVLVLGFVITLIADKAHFLFAVAPLVSAGGLAFIYNKAHDPAFELVLSTPISQVQILIARLALVFGYNFVLVVILAWGLSLTYSLDLIFPLILGWLAPMTFLSTLGLCISLFSNSENAIFISYSLWLSKYLMIMPEFRDLLGRAGEVMLFFWQNPVALYVMSACLFIAMLIYLQSSRSTTRQLV